MVNAELTPLSSPEFESGPPGIQSIELARVIDRAIRESKFIDSEKLCIEEGEKVWSVMVDISPVNDAGNLFDAGALGAIAALKSARFPGYDGERVDYKKHTDKKLPLRKTPISVTVHKIGDKLIVDPISDEEKSSDARLTVVHREDGKMCALQKGGTMPLSSDDIAKMIDLGIEKGKELAKALE